MFQRKIFSMIIFFTVITMLCGCNNNTEKTAKIRKNVIDENAYSQLDNKTCGWGFRRMKGRPEFTAQQTEMMDKYGCIYMGNEK